MAAEWDACEDCMGTGGYRDADGDGTCFACGGTGRLPANAEADALLARRERDRQQLAYDLAQPA